MSEYIICDKCKNEIECSENVRVAKGTLVLEYPVNCRATTFLDLCKDCYHKVLKFIKKNEE